MRLAVPLPALMRYAVFSSTPCTSRNSRLSAPATTPLRQLAPPLVVTVKLPPVPEAQTIFSLTALTACSRPGTFDFCSCRLAPDGATRGGGRVSAGGGGGSGAG